MNLDETNNLAPLKTNKIYDLKSQLSMRKRSEDILVACRRQFINDLLLAAFSLSSILILYFAVIPTQSEEFYMETRSPIDPTVFIKARNESNSTVTILRCTNILMTIVIRNLHTVSLIYRHYSLEVSKMIIRKLLSRYGTPYSDTLSSSGLLKKMLLEMLVMGVFCPPYLDYEFSGTMLNGTYTYSVEIIISILTMLRILQTIRIYTYFSIWLSPEAYELGKKLNIAPSLMFALKSDLKFQPQLVLVPTIGSLVLIMGYAVRNLERPYVSNTKCSLDFNYLTNGFWLAIVSMCTIGYGDGYPSTHLGRFIMVLTAGISLVAISLYIVALNIATMLSKEQSKAFYMIKDQKLGNVSRNNASNVIKNVFLIKKLMLNRNRPNYLRSLFFASGQLKRQFHNFTGNFVNKSKYLPPAEMIMQLEHKLVSNIDFIKKEIIDIDYIGERLQDLIKSEQDATRSIDDILAQQDKIDSMIVEMNLEPMLKRKVLENNLS